MHRRCNALTRGGGRCERPSAPNHWRCHLHGAGSRGPRYLTAEAIAARVARMQAGRERWLQRMRVAKESGPITRFPNGRRPRGAPKLHPDRTIRRAQKMIEARMAKDASLRVVPDDPGVDDAVLEPRAGPLEGSTATARPEAAESEGSAVAAAESLGEAEELLEELVIALLEARNPLNEADKTDSLWTLVASELSDGLWDRLDGWIDKHTTGTE